MAEFRNSTIPSFDTVNITNPTGTTTLRTTSTYDADFSNGNSPPNSNFPNQGVLLWWAKIGADKKPYNMHVGVSAGCDGVYTTPIRRGDDIPGPNVTIPCPLPGLPNRTLTQPTILAGNNGVLDTPESETQDNYFNDMSIYPSFNPRNTKPPVSGTTFPILTNINQETPIIRWFDGSVSSLRLRMAPIGTDGPKVKIEWGTIKLRIDTPHIDLPVSRNTFRISGLFGVDNHNANRIGILTLRSGGPNSTFRLQSVAWSCGSVIFRKPTGPPPGEYNLFIQSSTDAESNKVTVTAH